MKKINKIISDLKMFAQNPANISLDPKLSEDILCLCDEVERLSKDSKKLENCRKRLLNYEPF